MRFSDLLDRTEAKQLTQEAASELLRLTRTFQRWAERYEAEGDDGLVDRRIGRRSPRRAPHGKRANSIVKNMLLHSRSGSGEHRSVEINAIVEESLNLAFHGARAAEIDFGLLREEIDQRLQQAA